MKIIFLILIAFVFGCSKVVNPNKPVNDINSYSRYLAIQQLDIQTNILKDSCGKPLPNEQGLVLVKGFANKNTISQQNNKIILYSDSIITSRNVECNITADFIKTIYPAVISSFKINNWIPFVVKGHVLGIDFTISGVCKKSYKIYYISEVGIPI